MFTQTTHQVKVSVEVFFQPEFKGQGEYRFQFAYRVTIENKSEHALQLLRRKWNILDSNGELREVEGDGVVGEQPIIDPDTHHQYISGCHLQTEIGQMYGTYSMIRHSDGKKFEVAIPKFNLVVPHRLN